MAQERTSTDRTSLDTNRFTLRVIKKGVVHIDINDALSSSGYEGTATIDIGNIDGETFYPVVFVSWDGSGGTPEIVQYFSNQRNEWDNTGVQSKRLNWSVQSTGGSPNKLQLKINAWSLTSIDDDRFYYTITSLEAGPQILGDEEAWKFG